MNETAYVSPDLSTHEGTGTIPDSEVAWHEARNKAREDGVAAAEKHEADQAKAKADAEASPPAESTPKTTAKASSSGS